jgi:hypothetical protein
VLLPFVAALLVAAPAPKPLASYCSLCVRPPVGARRCGSFPVFRGAAGSGYSTVKLSTFGSPAPGVHRVTWQLGSGPLGPTLRVRV